MSDFINVLLLGRIISEVDVVEVFMCKIVEVKGCCVIMI